MKRRVRIQNLGGARALILHRPHPSVQNLTRQLTAIGLVVDAIWPEPGPQILAADFVFFDVDMGYDAQFPWEPGTSPMPMVALIGSEAPGRIEWALGIGAHAQILKPVGDSGVYSALLIARDAFDARRELSGRIADLQARLDDRQSVVQAVALLASRGMSERDAYGELRQLAMNWRITFEAAAHRVIARFGDEGGADDRRSHR